MASPGPASVIKRHAGWRGFESPLLTHCCQNHNVLCWSAGALLTRSLRHRPRSVNRQLRLVRVQGSVASPLILTSDMRRHHAAPNPN